MTGCHGDDFRPRSREGCAWTSCGCAMSASGSDFHEHAGPEREVFVTTLDEKQQADRQARAREATPGLVTNGTCRRLEHRLVCAGPRGVPDRVQSCHRLGPLPTSSTSDAS